MNSMHSTLLGRGLGVQPVGLRRALGYSSGGAALGDERRHHGVLGGTVGDLQQAGDWRLRGAAVSVLSKKAIVGTEEDI